MWKQAEPSYVALAVAHCTLGDAVIGAAALLAAVLLGRESALARWHWARISLLTILLGTAYTVFSEWMNITVLRSWSYTEAMPTLDLGGFRIGLTPLVQWLVLPPVALYLARRTRKIPAQARR